MRVLWISNIVFPEALQLLLHEGQLKSSGGWMLGAANALIETKESISLAVAAVCEQVCKLTILQGCNIRYYLLPKGKGNDRINHDYDRYWIEVKNDFRPDVVHIHGTECSHGLSYLDVCPNDNVVVSIQGLITYCAKYYKEGLTWWDILKNITFHDIIRGTIWQQQHLFERRGVYERMIIQRCNHIVGRTSWDRIHSTLYHPGAVYYKCNETLRDEFYCNELWDYMKCLKHTIFLSQASYPLKGLHILLKAMSIVILKYPDTVVRIGGKDIIRRKNFKDKIKFSGYGKIISSLIHKYRLEKNICFIGNLDANEMKNEYLKCNLFLCPSTVENSSNSLAEAQILGVPVVCSYAGGLPDMMKGNEDNMYRFDDFEALADIICRVFVQEGKQIDMSQIARVRHDKSQNALNLLSIYNSIINEPK